MFSCCPSKCSVSVYTNNAKLSLGGGYCTGTWSFGKQCRMTLQTSWDDPTPDEQWDEQWDDMLL